MEMAINNKSFVAMSEFDMFEIDGGVNWWGVASGVFTCVGAGLGIVASIVNPEPVSKSLGIYSSVSYFAAGVSAIGWALT